MDNAANEALVDFLAEALDLPRRAVRIVAGASSRRKIVELEGMSAEQASSKLLAH